MLREDKSQGSEDTATLVLRRIFQVSRMCIVEKSRLLPKRQQLNSENLSIRSTSEIVKQEMVD